MNIRDDEWFFIQGRTDDKRESYRNPAMVDMRGDCGDHSDSAAGGQVGIGAQSEKGSLDSGALPRETSSKCILQTFRVVMATFGE